MNEKKPTGYPMRPLSEVLLEFAEPFLGENPNDEKLRGIMVNLITIWNLALLPKKEQKLYWKQLDQAIRKGLPPDIAPGYLQELRACLDWRKTNYGEDQRFISHFEIVRVAGEPRLRIYSSLNSESKKRD